MRITIENIQSYEELMSALTYKEEFIRQSIKNNIISLSFGSYIMDKDGEDDITDWSGYKRN
jgi:hypothetical protein